MRDSTAGSYVFTSCPCSRRRSVIPLPMRPRPIIPSCIYVLLDVDARDAAAALLQRREVPGGLRADQPAEAERLAGDRQLVARVVDHLQEQPRVRAALVQLAGRVQIARAVPVRDDEAAAVAQRLHEAGDPLVVRGRRLDERLHADVVAGSPPARAARRPSPPARARAPCPCASTSFVLSFAAWTSGWSNGLISRYAPATATANSQRKNSAPSAYGSSICGAASCRSAPSGDSPGAGMSPLPCLPVDSAISCSAHRPKPPGVSRMQILSRPSCQPAPNCRPSSKPGLPSSRRQSSAIRSAFGEQPVDVDPHQRRRDDAERRQRGVAAADRRLAVEDVAEAALLREPLQVGARVGDGGERGAALAGLLPEVVRVRARLQRRAGLRRRDEQRPLEIERRLERADRGRVRRVEHVEAGRRRTCAAAPRARGSSRPCRAGRRCRSRRPRSPSANAVELGRRARACGAARRASRATAPRRRRSTSSSRAPRSGR